MPSSEPQIAGYPDLEVFLEQPTQQLRDELERIAAADRFDATIIPLTVGHAIALGQSAATRDDLRAAIIAELADRGDLTTTTGD